MHGDTVGREELGHGTGAIRAAHKAMEHETGDGGRGVVDGRNQVIRMPFWRDKIVWCIRHGYNFMVKYGLCLFNFYQNS